MTRYSTVRISPWAMERIRKNYLKNPDRMTKAALKASLADVPGTEFHTVATPEQRGGAVLTVAEAKREGIDVLEVRYNSDRDVAMVNTHTGKVS
jgi:hypothetical protein